ncbi:GL24482 [Drosophila persimilis]|uniref:GL24482 n=1 Tax=Drosophila persimilis TaxID=7234 RepID=B4G3V6_DROPE|nr:GL24482 [Drosophila persimilis]
MALCQTSVLKVYHAVIEDVITNVRDAFLDEGVDEQVLQEMKQIWRNKLLASKAVELTPDPSEGSHPPPIVANNPKVSKVCDRCLPTFDVDPCVHSRHIRSSSSTAAMAAKSPAAGAAAAGSGLKNGQMPIKQEVTSQNPPPLHPTSGGSIAQRQQASGGGQTPIPLWPRWTPTASCP